MRERSMGKWLGFGLIAVSTGFIPAGEPDGKTLPPPRPLTEPRKLRSELEALVTEREAARKELHDEPTASTERTKLRNEILELIKKMGEKKPAVAPPVVAPPVVAPMPPMPLPGPPKFLSEDPARTIDPLRMAQNLYRAGEHESALRAFYQIDLNRLAREDRAFVLYMSACYLRNQGKPAEAAVRFREIADLKDDSFLTESSISQLELMNKTKELEALSEQLRSRQKSK
jgi:hypothetical protein